MEMVKYFNHLLEMLLVRVYSYFHLRRFFSIIIIAITKLSGISKSTLAFCNQSSNTIKIQNLLKVLLKPISPKANFLQAAPASN
jgi:hypothetical protein